MFSLFEGLNTSVLFHVASAVWRKLLPELLKEDLRRVNAWLGVDSYNLNYEMEGMLPSGSTGSWQCASCTQIDAMAQFGDGIIPLG